MQPEKPSDPEVRTVQTPSGPASYTDEGPRDPGIPTVVAVHGLPGSSRDFRWLGAALEPSRRFVRLNMPGFGGTPLATMPRASLAARADWVASVVGALELERPVLLGHSMGGAVATAACARHPDRFAGLALLASVGPQPHQSVRRMSAPPQAISAVLRVPGVARLLERRLASEFERSGFKGWTTAQHVHTLLCLAALRFSEHARNLDRLKLPTFVAWTQDDPFIEEAISERLYWRCPAGPRVCFAAGGHNLQKTRAVELAEALTGWSLPSGQVV